MGIFTIIANASKIYGLVTAALALRGAGDTPENREALVQQGLNLVEQLDPAITTEAEDLKADDVAIENYIASKSVVNAEIVAGSLAKLANDITGGKITPEHLANIENSIQAGLADEGVK